MAGIQPKITAPVKAIAWNCPQPRLGNLAVSVILNETTPLHPPQPVQEETSAMSLRRNL